MERERVANSVSLISPNPSTEGSLASRDRSRFSARISSAAADEREPLHLLRIAALEQNHGPAAPRRVDPPAPPKAARSSTGGPSIFSQLSPSLDRRTRPASPTANSRPRSLSP